MARGRKRKQGKRHPGGKLVRTPKIDKGTPETQARRARYAGRSGGDRFDPAQTIDPVGRAWCGGLLSEEQRDAARRFAALYWRKLPDAQGNPVSGLYRNIVNPSSLQAATPRVVEDADARDERQEAALNRMLAALPRQGTPGRTAFDQLVLDPWFDNGPPWLDRLLGGVERDDDPTSLDRALQGIDAIA